MTASDETDPALAPDDAFGVLGNETRVRILRALGEADAPLSFSELRDRVGVRDSGQFNYHLDKLDGHFVARTQDKYTLRQPGQRVVEAVLSGAVTDAPRLDRTEIDLPCPYCGTPIEVRFLEERVEAYCPACPGTFKYSSRETETSLPSGYIGTLHLPPAGIQGRSAREIVEAGAAWGTLEFMAGSMEMCPRCSAPVDRAVQVCEDHEPAGGICERCGARPQVRLSLACTNCIYEQSGVFALALRADPALIRFQLDHGLNPLKPEDVTTFMRFLIDYDEDVVSTDPFEARLTFRLDDEELTLTVDDEFEVIDAARAKRQ